MKYTKADIEQSGLNEIAEQIKQGFTSGKLEGENGENVSWELKTEIWKD